MYCIQNGLTRQGIVGTHKKTGIGATGMKTKWFNAVRSEIDEMLLMQSKIEKLLSARELPASIPADAL